MPRIADVASKTTKGLKEKKKASKKTRRRPQRKQGKASEKTSECLKKKQQKASKKTNGGLKKNKKSVAVRFYVAWYD